VQQMKLADRPQADQGRRIADDDHDRPRLRSVERSCSKSSTS
jgi:hypothetical protein